MTARSPQSRAEDVGKRCATREDLCCPERRIRDHGRTGKIAGQICLSIGVSVSALRSTSLALLSPYPVQSVHALLIHRFNVVYRCAGIMNHARQVFALPQVRDEEGLRHRLRRPEGKTSILLKNSSLKITFFEGRLRRLLGHVGSFRIADDRSTAGLGPAMDGTRRQNGAWPE